MRSLVTAMAMVAVTMPAFGETTAWDLDLEASTLGFVGRQNDAEVAGRFERFTADIRFAEDALAASSVRLEVDVASVHLGDDRDEIARGSAWFGVADFPKAVFEATGFEATTEGYRALGTLAVKGVEQPVPITFTVTIDGDRAIAEGGAELLRTDFGVGPEGPVFGVSVAPEVDINFRIVATRAE